MKRIVLFLFIMIFLVGCGRENTKKPDFSLYPFKCDFCFDIGDTHYLCGAFFDGVGLEIEYKEPDSMKGIVICKVGDDIKAKKGDFEISLDTSEFISQVEGLFFFGGEVVSSSLCDYRGERVNLLTLQSGDEKCMIYLSSRGEVPLKICKNFLGDWREAEILFFEKVKV